MAPARYPLPPNWPTRSELLAAVRRAMANNVGVREAARLEQNRLRALGVNIGLEDYFRTEMARIHCNEVFDRGLAGGWTGETIIFRQVSGSPCRDCLRLAYDIDGYPRLYRVAELSRGSARWPNKGPRRLWRPKVGPVHRNCLCAAWAEWHPMYEGLFAQFAPAMAEQIKRFGLA